MKWIESESGKRQYKSVSPIYENSRIAQTVWDAIGKEYDTFESISRELMLQIKPETATFLLPIWEQRYGVIPATDNADERRNAVITRRSFRKPMSPMRIQIYLSNLSRRNVYIEEHLAPYTFGVYFLNSQGSEPPVHYSHILNIIKRFKQAHMAFEVGFRAHLRLTLGITTSHLLFPFPLCGTVPQDNMTGALESPQITIHDGLIGAAFNFNETSISSMTGTYPHPISVGEQEQRGVSLDASGTAYQIHYTPCGTTACGD